eukprot:TRINITY_DN9089_c0_g1_i3.p1 TRINITY_DN9089_c0_g1~~TRINITY_DN9089_c0_g1_i3.p1  ORF type:complete len:1244 (+),score=477.40 TRINITY_DN9089_c0_g1_i3:22-3753(+)
MSDEQDTPRLADWEVLQAKIFCKWCNQKLMSRHFPLMKDIRTELGKDNNLANLIYALTEADVPESKTKPRKLPMVKVQVLEQIEKALKMVKDAGVELKTRVSSENLYSGDFKDVMALVWGIMLKFIKFDDDEDGEDLSATDALLKWLQFHLKDYPQVQVTNLTKSFHDGMAFCCLIHKFKPDAIDVSKLDPANKTANLQLAMDKAEELFEIEKYLTPADIPKLNDKAMLVYCSEYYYQINEQAKRELAAKRIAKLVRFTQENDAARAKYEADGEVMLDHLTKAEGLLEGVETVTNTMQGAKQHLDDFGTYKTQQKKAIVSKHLAMEANYNTLSLRLANHNRPVYVPANEQLVPGTLSARIAALQAKEVVEPALHAELNRQIKLQQLDTRHKTSCAKLQQWITDKSAYVNGDFSVASSGQARQKLTQFEAFERENASMQDQPQIEVINLGATLAVEKFEHLAEVQQREADLKAAFALLTQAAQAKKPILEDNLQRETFREKTELDVQIHSDVYATIDGFNTDKQDYFKTKETIATVNDAYLQLSVLDACLQEIKDIESGSTVRLCTLGAAIRAAKYESQYSSWAYPKPEEVQGLEEQAKGFVASLLEAVAGKKAVLEDALAREQFKEKVGLMVNNHARQHGVLAAWAAEQRAYLETKEDNTTSQDAKYQLSRLEQYVKEKANMTEGALASLKALGVEIRAAEYKTDYSQWKYEKPEEVSALETELDGAWVQLDEAQASKQAVLEDDLSRLLYAEQTRLLASQHADKHSLCKSHAETKVRQLTETIVVNSIADAQLLISQLSSLEADRIALEESVVAALCALGKTVLARKYETSLSSYVYEEPQAIKEREAAIAGDFAKLAELAAQRDTTLQELLAKETRKEELRLEYANLAADFERYCQDKIGDLGTAEQQKTFFGFSLDEIEAYDSQLKQEDSGINNVVQSKQAAYAKVVDEMQQLDVKDNPYTSTTVSQLEAAAKQLAQAQEARLTLYAAELARHRENDAKCKAYADVVKPLSAQLKQLMDTAMSTAASEEEQLATINDALAKADSVKPDFAAIQSMESDIKQRGVIINPHTSVSSDDVLSQWENYMQVLEQRQPYLDNVVQYKRYRGISPEQYAEMEAIFKTYDKDSSNNINEKELRSCLFSLGEERTKKEVASYMKQYGSNGVLAFEPFRELMIMLLGDAGTVEGLHESFRLLSQGAPTITVDRLAKVLDTANVEYLQANAKQADDGLDYSDWIHDVFAR